MTSGDNKALHNHTPLCCAACGILRVDITTIEHIVHTFGTSFLSLLGLLSDFLFLFCNLHEDTLKTL